MAAIQRCFPYIFDGGKKESSVPQLEARLIDGAPVELFGLEFLPVPVVHGAPDDLRLSLRLRGLPHRPQRHPGILPGAVALARRALPGRAALQTASDAFHGGNVHQDRGETGRRGGPSSRISVMTWRTSARKASCRRTSGWRTTAWRSSRCHEDLPQPCRGARGLRSERPHHRQFRRRAFRPPADSAAVSRRWPASGAGRLRS